MTKEVVTTVTGVEVRGPIKRRDGDGEFHVLAVNTEDGEFTKYFNDRDVTPAVGDEVKILFTEATKKSGEVYRTIVKLGNTALEVKKTKATKAESVTEEKQVSKRLPWEGAKTPSQAPQASMTSEVKPVPAVKPYVDNSRGMRNGMLTNKAVDLAIARHATDNLEDLKLAADDVMKLASYIEQKNQ